MASSVEKQEKAGEDMSELEFNTLPCRKLCYDTARKITYEGWTPGQWIWRKIRAAGIG